MLSSLLFKIFLYLINEIMFLLFLLIFLVGIEVSFVAFFVIKGIF